jgi:hypothetical protein
MEFKAIVGLTFKSIHVKEDNTEILFVSNDNRRFLMSHYQDCCETVEVESIEGSLLDLIDTPILEAEESSNSSTDEGYKGEEVDGSCTWTFYKIRTIKGYVTIRWVGSSNGYYSESVDFEELTN